MPDPIRYARSRPKLTKAQIQRRYDRTARDLDAKRFYNSEAWKKTRLAKLSRDPLCERCEREGRMTRADVVHHLRELADYPDGALDLANLESLCHPCHNRHHKRKR